MKLRTALVIGCLFAAASGGAAERVPVLRHLLFQGNENITTDVLSHRIPLKPGQPVKQSTVRISMDLLRSVYQDKGYYRVTVSSEALPVAADQIDLTFRIEEGDVYRIG